MRYFILSAHGGIGYLAALRILDQDPNDVCTFLVPFGETEIWTADPRLAAHIITKAALVVTGDAQNIDDIQRAWHTAEMGIDSERSGIEAVIISDSLVSNHRHPSNAEELLSILKCFPAYPYPAFSMDRKLSATYSTRTQSTYSSPATPLYIPRSPSYSVRPPRLIVVSPSRSLKRLRTGRESKEESLIAWATGKKAGSTTFTPISTHTEPSTPIHSDSRSTHSAYSGSGTGSGRLTPNIRAPLFPEEQKAGITSGGWLDPKYALIVRPAVLMRRRCRGDESRSSTPYRIQEEFTLRDRGGGWTISKRDVAHFIVEKALEEWGTWGGRRVRIAY